MLHSFKLTVHEYRSANCLFHGTQAYLTAHEWVNIPSSSHCERKTKKKHSMNWSLQYQTKDKFTSFCCEDLNVTF
jgi:hypothetical protein